MDDLNEQHKHIKELTVNRRYLAFAGSFYLLWWFAVDMILPTAFNPFISRFVIVVLAFLFLALSFVSSWFRRHLQIFFIICMWLITLHYYYLFYENSGDINWVVGSYITVIAVSLCLPSSKILISYTIFVLLLSVAMVIELPLLQSSVFLPGIFTILFQANVGLHTRLRVIKNLLESNQRFKLLFNSTFEGVLVHENQRIIDVNDSLLGILGYSRTELIGKNVLEFLYPNERDLVIEKMKLDDVPPFETKGFSKEGTAIDIEIRAKNFFYDGRIVRLVTLQEISDRKRAEMGRIEALTMAENVRVRDEFISLASHELKTPLSSLKLQTQIVERDLKRNDQKVYTAIQLNELITFFNKQINRLTELVESMLDVTRISSTKLQLDRQYFDFVALIKETAELLQVPNFNIKQSLELELPDSLMIWGDPNRIKQVVENLLTNAAKYGEGKPIHVKIVKEAKYVVLTVEDHGFGIGEEFIERIFYRFERAVSSRNISGLGLGLFIAHQIVKAHGGDISVKSQLHVGSTFTVKLPISKPQP